MHRNILHNDQIHPVERPTLRAGQAGLLSGWGVFTTMRIYEGVPFAFERHWNRLVKDARLLHVDLPDASRLRSGLLRLIEANDAREARMRVCVVRNNGGPWSGPDSGKSSDVIAITADLGGSEEPVALDYAEHCRHAAAPYAGTKTLSWAWNLALAEEARRKGFAEVILLNEYGEVTECASANLFAVKNGVTYTPPLSAGPLQGVTRAIMLEELDSRVAERSLRLDDVLDADEVFITSTTRHLLPVYRVRDQWVGQGRGADWPIMQELQKALSAYVKQYVDERRERPPRK